MREERRKFGEKTDGVERGGSVFFNLQGRRGFTGFNVFEKNVFWGHVLLKKPA